MAELKRLLWMAACTAGQMEGWKHPLWMTGHIVADR
jgi:hypothetical protein